MAKKSAKPKQQPEELKLVPLPAGVIFKVGGTVPTSIPPDDILGKSSGVFAKKIDENTIELNFKVQIKNASLSTSGFDIPDGDVATTGHFAFSDIGKQQLTLKAISSQKFADGGSTDVVNFSIEYRMGGAKIGGAGFRRIAKKKKP